MQKTAADIASDTRYRCERIAQDLGVPWQDVVQFVANNLGGLDKYCEPGDVAGPYEVQEKVLAFCRAYVLDHLPAGQRGVVGFMADRKNRIGRRQFIDEMTPIMRLFNVQLSDWDDTFKQALHIPSLMYLHKYAGSLDQAKIDVINHLKKVKGDMADIQLKERTGRIREILNGWYADLGITDKTKQRTHEKNALRATVPEVASGNDPMEKIEAQINAYFKPIKEQHDELKAHGLGQADEASVNQEGLFNDDLAKSAAELGKLPDVKVDFKGDPVKPVETVAQAADSTPAAAVAPAGENKPAEPPAAQDAGQSSTPPAEAKAEPEKEVTSFGFQLDFVLNDQTTYALDARYNKETGDVWMATATVKGRELDETTRAQLFKDIDVNLKARKAAEVVLDVRYEPTVEQINQVKNRCYELAAATYKDESQEYRLGKIRDAWNGMIAKDAIGLWGTQGAYDKVHEAFAQLEVEIADEGPKALATTSQEIALPQNNAAASANVLQFPALPELGMFIPSPARLSVMKEFAGWTAKSGMYPNINTFDKAMMICWRSDELHVPWGTGLRGIHIINGKPWEGAEVLKAVVDNSGLADRFDVTLQGTDKAIALVKRKGKDPVTVEYSMEEARQAGLVDKQGSNWKKSPKMMLIWRVTRRACILHFADLCAGLGISLIEQDPYDDAGDETLALAG